MLDPVKAKARLIGVIAAAFVGGIMLATGMEWTAGSHAAGLLQQPAASDVRPLAELSESFISIAESVTPAVVSIRAERPAPAEPEGNVPEEFRRFFRPPGPQEAGGTGFLISRDGHIITNNHVVAEATAIRVVTMDRREYRARLVGRDPMTDIAVIKIEGESFPTVRFGDPQAVQVGEWVLAIGNPLGLDFTVTAGIVSAKNRSNLNILRQAADEELRNLTVESFIQTDAAINPGNSGGPLVNIRGEVIGVNTAIASQTGLSQGYGFAVPIDLGRRVAEDLIRYGRWRRSLLGVSIAEVDPEAVEAFELPAVAGAIVQDFSQPGTPAQRAGVMQGDVIVAVDGRPVTRVSDLQRMIASYRPGDRVKLDVIRYGDRHSFDVPLMESDATGPVVGQASNTAQPIGRPVGAGGLGITVAELTPELARTFGYSRPGGIVINEAEPTGALFQRFGNDPRGLKVVSVDRQPVEDAAAFDRAIASKQPGSVVSLVLEQLDGRQLIVNVRLPR